MHSTGAAPKRSPLRAEHVCVLGEAGTSFGHKPLTTGYLHVVGRLPDFLGGPAMVGTWLENGSAFDVFSNAHLETQIAVGVIAETLVGPAMIGYSVGAYARRLHVSFGRLFR